MTASLWLGWLLIFFARVTDMTLATIRTLFLVRGRSWQAGLFGFFEALVYIIALKMVFQHLDSYFSFIFYAAGFGCGNIIGSLVEEKMAIGYLVVQIVTKKNPELLATKLRMAGFGVTLLEGEGLHGKQDLLDMVIRRRDNDRLLELVKGYDEHAFIAISEARAKIGGVPIIRLSK